MGASDGRAARSASGHLQFRGVGARTLPAHRREAVLRRCGPHAERRAGAQGGFRLLDRSRDCGPERGGLVALPGTLTTDATGGGSGRVVAQLDLSAPASIAMTRIAYTSSVDANGRLRIEYRDGVGGWHDLATIALRTKRQLRAVGRPPGRPVTATALRAALVARATPP